MSQVKDWIASWDIVGGVDDEMNRPAVQHLESINVYLHRCERGSVHRYSVEMVVE